MYKLSLKNIIKDYIIEQKSIISEVRYLDPSKNETPIFDNETIRVYHGLSNFEDVENILKFGLSGKVRAKRRYSYEFGNNPYGLFVSVNFDVVKKNFADSGVIIEFTTKVSDLEAPVWVGGRSYYVQGEYADTFKDEDERENQRLINRKKSSESPYDYISKSDRPELADVLFKNAENQALFVGDLNANMIKYIWYNQKLHLGNQIGGKWVRMSRKEFIKYLNIDTNKKTNYLYYPNDDFTLENFKEKVGDDFENYMETIYYDFKYEENSLYDIFYPKQLAQIKKLYNDGVLDKFA